jgi:hypothetical protein
MTELEREQEEDAAAEAAAIGGRVSSERPPLDGGPDEAERPLAEAGEGESEGFEEAETALAEHASHGDEYAAHRVMQDAPEEFDDPRAAQDAKADAERSSELRDAPQSEAGVHEQL